MSEKTMKPSNQPIWDILFILCIVVACVAGLVAIIAFLSVGYMLAARATAVTFFTGLGALLCNNFRVDSK